MSLSFLPNNETHTALFMSIRRSLSIKTDSAVYTMHLFYVHLSFGGGTADLCVCLSGNIKPDSFANVLRV